MMPSPQITAVLLAEGEVAGSGLGGMVPIVLMFVVIYFIVLRPMSKQEKERRKRVDALSKGDEVVLQGGILGRVTNVEDPKIAVVEIAPKVRVRVLKKDINDTKAAALEADKDKDKGKGKAAKDDESDDAKSKSKSKDSEATDEGARKGA